MTTSTSTRWFTWLNLGFTLLLVGVGFWYLAHKVTLTAVASALLLADSRYILLGVFVMIATILLKTWRWQIMLSLPGNPKLPPFMPLFWATMLGQYVNLIVPFLRLGEIARIYALYQQTQISKARSLGTLVVEKTLDLIFFGLTLALLLPLVVLPSFVSSSSIVVGVISLFMLLALYLLAYQTPFVIRLLRAIAQKLPPALGKRLMRLAVAGLEGLATLRQHRLSLYMVGSSLLVALLAVLLPYVLFPAFGLPLGLVEGALMHVVVSVASAPPSTPAKIGVFNSAAAFLLLSLGIQDEAAVVSYAIVFHLVVMGPQILLGSMAASRTNWRWQTTVQQQDAP